MRCFHSFNLQEKNIHRTKLEQLANIYYKKC